MLYMAPQPPDVSRTCTSSVVQDHEQNIREMRPMLMCVSVCASYSGVVPSLHNFLPLRVTIRQSMHGPDHMAKCCSFPCTHHQLTAILEAPEKAPDSFSAIFFSVSVPASIFAANPLVRALMGCATAANLNMAIYEQRLRSIQQSTIHSRHVLPPHIAHTNTFETFDYNHKDHETSILSAHIIVLEFPP